MTTALRAGERGRLRDPGWFPADLDMHNQCFLFAQVTETQIAGATFLDNRFDIDWSRNCPIPIGDVLPGMPQRTEMAWLWHTSFCGSTLLARALDAAPWANVLREPLVLRRLSDARDAGYDIGASTAATVALLARRWHEGGKVVVKPTHAALNIARDIVACMPGDRAVVLTSSLDDFLVSNLKKSPETQAKAATLAERALRAGDFHRRLSPAAFNPPDHLCAIVLQWAAQRELVADLLASAGAEMRVVASRDLFADLAGTALDCARWLRIETPEAVLRAHCTSISGRHAKAPNRQYDASVRESEKRALHASHAGELGAARTWAERHVLPRMQPLAISMAP